MTVGGAHQCLLISQKEKQTLVPLCGTTQHYQRNVLASISNLNLTKPLDLTANIQEVQRGQKICYVTLWR